MLAMAADEVSLSSLQEVDEVLDSARQSISSATEQMARGVDGWFGDKPFSAGSKVSDGRLSVSLRTRQHKAPTLAVRFNARFRLPNVESRTYFSWDPTINVTSSPTRRIHSRANRDCKR